MQTIENKPELYIKEGEVCPIKVVSNLIAGKWKILILWHLSQQKRRCGEIQKLLPSASKGVLAKQLNELVENKLIIKKVYEQRPLKVEYSLSEVGESFIEILEVMRIWGDDYINKIYK